MMYFITPNYSLALIPKAGCSTLCRCVIKSFQPNEENLIQHAAYPDGANPNTIMWHSYAKKEKSPSKPTIAMIREPLSRFVSAMAQMGLSDVDAAIDSLTSGTEMQGLRRIIRLNRNQHFTPQIRWIHPDTKLYKFPEHLNEAATEIGFSLPVPVINAAVRPKPTLTQTQTEALEQYYSEDIALFNSITVAGIVTGIVASDYAPPDVASLE